MAAKWNNYIDHGAKEMSFCNFDSIRLSSINIVLSYVYIIQLLLSSYWAEKSDGPKDGSHCNA